MNSLLVPVDGSNASASVMPIAVRIARRLGVSVILARVHVPAYPLFMTSSVSELDMKTDRRSREHERAELEEFARQFADSDVPVSAELLDGPIVPTLMKLAAKRNGRMIVMAAHGRGAFTRALLGSVADEIIRQSDIPVLVCRRKPGNDVTVGCEGFRHVLVALDGSARAESVLTYALASAGSAARYTLLRVRVPGDVMGFAFYAASIERDSLAEEEKHTREADELERKAKELRHEGYTVHELVTYDAEPSRAILKYSRDHDVDLIALASHGRQGLQRMLHSSVSARVVHGFDGAVLIYTPRAPTAVSGEGSAPALERPAFRELTRDECVTILRNNHVGRLAFSVERGVDIEPLSYVYDDGWLLGRTAPGQKLTALSHQWNVAFEVDEVAGIFDWRSVVVHGGFYRLDESTLR